MRRGIVLLACWLVAGALPALAGPAPVLSLDKLETLSGPLEIRTEGSLVTVSYAGNETARPRIFEIEAGGGIGLPVAARLSTGGVLYWRGHLIVLDSASGSAWHFSIPGQDRPAAAARPGITPATSGLNALLAEYDVTTIEASSISSWAGPQAFARREGLRSATDKIDFQDLGGTGVGSCGSSCSISCRDGSKCEISCGDNRCASCVCPLACSCK
jgi:hypothetical protein